MIEKDVIVILAIMDSALASWVIYLLYKVQELKENTRITRDVLEYYKDKVIKYEAKMLRIKEELKDD